MTPETVKKTLLVHWPKLPHVWLKSKDNHVPELEEIRKIIPLSGVRDIPYQEGKMECENYALFLHAFVKKHYLGLPYKHQVAFGEVLGLRMETVNYDKSHAMNIVITQQGVYLIEPQTYQIVKPAKGIRPKDRNFVYKVVI